ncbi:MAG: hypothetical protein J6N21_16705 [Butyrivibrio sp.]|nr:hypothetical protein [Butyrivibrio sp.]
MLSHQPHLEPKPYNYSLPIDLMVLPNNWQLVAIDFDTSVVTIVANMLVFASDSKIHPIANTSTADK